jgi:two-component system LytT family response regulator
LKLSVFSTSPIKSRAEIDFLNPDVLFLDINMPGLNGFDFVETFAKRQFQIVFVTAFEEHALHALKIGATDYLIKPIIIEDLRLAIDKVKLHHVAKSVGSAVASDAFPMDQKLPLLYHNNYVLTDLADIVLAEADNNYTRFFIKDSDPIIMSKTLKEYETKLTPVGLLSSA